MKRNIVLAMLIVGSIAGTLYARGFGGGGGGGFHGGGFGGGGFHGGGGFGGGGFGGGGGYGGGGFHGGDFGGGGYGGGGFRGGGYGGGGYRGDSGGAGEFRSGGFNNNGLGGQGYRAGAGDFGDLSAQSGAFRGGQFGSASAAGRGFDSFGGMRSDSPPTAGRLDSFLGLPTDMGMHQASGEHAFGYTGSARGLSGYNPAAAGGGFGERGAVAGPGGAAAGERGATGRVYEGPNGTTIAHGSAAERGAAVGPNGAAAGGRAASGTVVKGPNGNVYARGETASRGVVAGPNGVAGGARVAGGAAVRGPEGNVVARGGEVTRNWSAGDLRVQGNYARNNFHDYNAFNRGWYHDHPNAWYAAGFASGFWAGCNWANITGWFGTDWPSYGYMYGNDLTYIDNNVCLYGEPIATAAEYYDSAAALAQTGEQANIPNTPPPQNDSQQPDPANAQWLPLGVFEAIPTGQKSSNMMFQLAVNKAGIIRGNFFDSADKNVQQIQGSVDKQTQRVAWVVASKKNMIFDCGLYNLTKQETPVLVHVGKDKNEQWTLVRMQQPSDDKKTQ